MNVKEEGAVLFLSKWQEMAREMISEGVNCVERWRLMSLSSRVEKEGG